MVQQKCQELGWNLDVSSVISDFELNIMKSIDEMLDTDILGCFFHFKKIFKEKVDKKGFKSRYEKDMKFRKFINECSSIAHLPEELLEVAVDHIDQKYVFEDEKTQRFKDYFIQYIKDYWINGCYPPRTWNCWSRSEDLTNNNQEGYNSKTNKTLDQNYPSPGLQLCNVINQIREAHDILARIKVGIEKPKKNLKYARLAKRRLKLKKNLKIDLTEGNTVNSIDTFLSSMGNNISKSVSAENTKMYKKSQSKNVERYDSCGDDSVKDVSMNISNWHPTKEASILEEMEQTKKPYSHRVVGTTARVQKVREQRPYWVGKTCQACQKKFNKLSLPVVCVGCDSFTDRKNACLSGGTIGDNYECKACKPAINKVVNKEISHEDFHKEDNCYKCKVCGYQTLNKHNMKRHVQRKHENQEVSQSNHEDANVNKVVEFEETKKPKEKHKDENVTLPNLLKELKLGYLEDKFIEEDINIEDIINMNEADLKDMCKVCGLNYGPQFRFLHKVRKIKKVIEMNKTENNQDKKAKESEPEKMSTPIPKQHDTKSDSTKETEKVTEKEATMPKKSPECKMCKEAKNSRTPHKCRNCGEIVCNFYCSVQDPKSDNEMHRIHKKNMQCNDRRNKGENVNILIKHMHDCKLPFQLRATL